LMPRHLAGHLRSRRRRWLACGLPCPGRAGCWGSRRPLAVTKCSGRWYWRESSSRPGKLDSLRVIEEARVDPVSYAVRVGESGALRRV